MITKKEFHEIVIQEGVDRVAEQFEPKIKLTKKTSLITMMVTVQFQAEWCGYLYNGSLEYKDRGAALNHESEYLVEQRIFKEMKSG